MNTTLLIVIIIVGLLIAIGYWFLSGGSKAKIDDDEELERDAGQARAPRAQEKRDEEPQARPASSRPEGKEKAAPSEDEQGEGEGAEAAATSGTPAETKAEEPSRSPEPTESAQPSAQPKLSEDELAEIKKERRKALRRGLKETRGGFIAKLGSLLKGKKELDPELLDKIEEVLLTADVGVQFTEKLVKNLKDNLSNNELTDPEQVWTFMSDQAHTILTPEGAPPFDVNRAKPFVIMVIGVNGVGKTTTIAKLAAKYIEQEKKVILAAGDTFRAAAVRQLEMWGKRVGAEVVKNDKSGADPSSVVFDAIEKGVSDEADIVIADTAGRLHTKAPLMEELKKVKRVMGKALAGAPHEVLLVLDANTGQNAVAQTREFQEALDVTGIVLTKLDGTAKGGVILGICEEFQIPVRFVGVGERDDDLREFDADDFVSILFERPDEHDESAA